MATDLRQPGSEITPEQQELLRKQQEEAAEFSNAKEAETTSNVRKFSTQAEKEVMPDTFNKIARIGDKEVPSSEFEHNTESGLPPIEEEKRKNNPIAWINEAIGSNLTPYQQNIGVERINEDESKKAA